MGHLLRPTFHPNLYHHHSSVLDKAGVLEEVCQGDRECLFDGAVTGRVDVAAATRQGNLQMREILELTVPSQLPHV